MKQPAAKQGDTVTALNTHLVVLPNGSAIVQTLPFGGIIQGNLSPNVTIMKRAAATVGSTANNTPAHVPIPPGVSFVHPPTNIGTIVTGSLTVTINRKPAAR